METSKHKLPDQRSLSNQLEDLIDIANDEGMYDAADWLRNTLSGWAQP